MLRVVLGCILLRGGLVARVMEVFLLELQDLMELINLLCDLPVVMMTQALMRIPFWLFLALEGTLL